MDMMHFLIVCLINCMLCNIFYRDKCMHELPFAVSSIWPLCSHNMKLFNWFKINFLIQPSPTPLPQVGHRLVFVNHRDVTELSVKEVEMVVRCSGDVVLIVYDSRPEEDRYLGMTCKRIIGCLGLVLLNINLSIWLEIELIIEIFFKQIGSIVL